MKPIAVRVRVHLHDEHLTRPAVKHHASTWPKFDHLRRLPHAIAGGKDFCANVRIRF
jgi:hypothetical protein